MAALLAYRVPLIQTSISRIEVLLKNIGNMCERQCRTISIMPQKIVASYCFLLIVQIGSTAQCQISESFANYLKVVELSVDRFEPIFVEQPQSKTAYFDFTRYDTWSSEDYAATITIPGNGMLLLCYATLLEFYSPDQFPIGNLSRDELLRRSDLIFRWLCLSHDSCREIPFLPNISSTIKNGPYWTKRPLFRADLIGYASIAFLVLGDKLPHETQKKFLKLCESCTHESIKIPTFNVTTGGNHDMAKHELSSAFIHLLFGEQPNHYADERLSELLILMTDAATNPHNKNRWARDDLIRNQDGRNLYPDHTSDHHGHDSVWYGVDMLFEGVAYIALSESFLGRDALIDDRIRTNINAVYENMEQLVLPNGALGHIHGSEYDSYYGAAALPCAFHSSYIKSQSPSALETSASSLLLKHFAHNHEYDYHKAIPAKACLAILIRDRFQDKSIRNNISSSSAASVYVRPFQNTMLLKGIKHWSSFSWGSQTHWQLGHGIGMQFSNTPPSSLEPDKLQVYFREYNGIGRITSCDLFAPLRNRSKIVILLAVIFAFCVGLVGKFRHQWISVVRNRRAIIIPVGILMFFLCFVMGYVLFVKYYQPKLVSSVPRAISYDYRIADNALRTFGEIEYRDVLQQIAFDAKADGTARCHLKFTILNNCTLNWTGVNFSFFDPFMSVLAASHIVPLQRGKIHSRFVLPVGAIVNFDTPVNSVVTTRGKALNWARNDRYLHDTINISFNGFTAKSFQKGDVFECEYTIVQ